MNGRKIFSYVRVFLVNERERKETQMCMCVRRKLELIGHNKPIVKVKRKIRLLTFTFLLETLQLKLQTKHLFKHFLSLAACRKFDSV